MSARSLVWPLLVWSVGACRGKSAPAPEPPASGSSATAGATDGGAMAAVATVDAAAAPDAAAPPPARKTKLEIGDKVPDFGCLGWSPRRKLAACVVGSRGSNLGDSKVELVFVAMSPAAGEPPEPITILELEESGGRGPDELSPALVTRLERALQGFVPWDRDGARITSERVGDQLVMSPAVSVGGMTISVRVTPAPRLAYATQFSVLLFVRVPSGGNHVVTETTGAIGDLEVRGFALPDRAGPGTVLVEQVHSIGDEGVSGTQTALWRCTSAGCDAL